MIKIDLAPSGNPRIHFPETLSQGAHSIELRPDEIGMKVLVRILQDYTDSTRIAERGMPTQWQTDDLTKKIADKWAEIDKARRFGLDAKELL